VEQDFCTRYTAEWEKDAHKKELTLTQIFHILKMWGIGDLDVIWHMAIFDPNSTSARQFIDHFVRKGGNLLFGVNATLCRPVDDHRVNVPLIRKMVRLLPLADLVTETDSPFLYFDQDTNTPATIPLVICGISRVKEVPVKHVIEAVNNTMKLFLNHYRQYRPLSLNFTENGWLGQMDMDEN
jgi:Tat protein secretion system quality control protein TatD with DNase activity